MILIKGSLTAAGSRDVEGQGLTCGGQGDPSAPFAVSDRVGVHHVFQVADRPDEILIRDLFFGNFKKIAAYVDPEIQEAPGVFSQAEHFLRRLAEADNDRLFPAGGGQEFFHSLISNGILGESAVKAQEPGVVAGQKLFKPLIGKEAVSLRIVVFCQSGKIIQIFQAVRSKEVVRRLFLDLQMKGNICLADGGRHGNDRVDALAGPDAFEAYVIGDRDRIAAEFIPVADKGDAGAV